MLLRVPDGKLHFVSDGAKKQSLAYDPPGDLANDGGVDDGTGLYKRIWLTRTGLDSLDSDRNIGIPKWTIPR